VRAASIALMMEAVRTSETSVYSETTRRYIPEGSNLHTRRRENLKSRMIKINLYCSPNVVRMIKS
jgi:hypothetical protein